MTVKRPVKETVSSLIAEGFDVDFGGEDKGAS